jgi:hypothetical protein
MKTKTNDPMLGARTLGPAVTAMTGQSLTINARTQCTLDPAATPRDAGLDAAVAEARARRRAEDAALIGAQEKRAKPAVDRARAAIATLEAFGQAFEPQLLEYRKQLAEPELDQRFAHGQHAQQLAQARAQVETLLMGIAQVPGLKRTIAELEHLEMKDLQPFCIVGNRIERLNGPAGFADALPADLTAVAASMAEIGRLLARLIAEAGGSPVLDAAPPPARVDAPPPRLAPVHAKGAVTHGGDDA